MRDLEEIKERILSELEWAGEENVPTLMNTVLPQTGDDEEARLIVVALRKLVSADLIRLATSYDETHRWKELSIEESLAEISLLPSALVFVSGQDYWTDARWEGARLDIPQVVVTDAGMAEAEEILERRGYQWWNRKEKAPKVPIIAVELPEAFASICGLLGDEVEKKRPSYGEMAALAVRDLTDGERLELAVFIDDLLAGGYTGDELRMLWRRAGAIRPFRSGEQIRLLLTLMREKLPQQ